MIEFAPKIADGIQRCLGLAIQPTQYKTLMDAMQRVAQELGWGSDAALWGHRLHANLTPEVVCALARVITIGETYFMREKPAMQFFRQIIIPEIERRRQRNQLPYRIWSAGCSSGEEPYSLAILLKEHSPHFDAGDVTILATDVNPDALHKARKGAYTAWSFRETDPSIQNAYFTKVDKHWIIKPEIKQMVQFATLNLVLEDYPSPSNGTAGIDLIFCRNVLMYFEAKTIHDVVSRFNQGLAAGGWLVTSQVELNDEYFDLFGKIAHAGGFFYRRLFVASRQRTDKRARAGFHNRLEIKTTKPSTGKPGKRSPILKPINSSGSNAFVEDKSGSTESPQPDTPLDQSKSYNKTALRTKIRQLADEGLLQKALPLAEELCQTGTADPDDFFLLASLQLAYGDQQLAEDNFMKTLYLDPDRHEARLHLALLLQKSGRQKSANHQFNLLIKALETMPTDQVVFGDMQPSVLISVCKLAMKKHEGT